MELKDTIELMQSEYYKDRFKAEYYQIKIRLEKLEAMLEFYSCDNSSIGRAAGRLYLTKSRATRRG